MQRYLAPIAVSAVLVGVTGCGSAETPTSATTSASAAPISGLGTAFAFTDASSGAKVGTITFTEVALAPAECVTELLPGRVALAVRAQIESIGTSRMSRPDQWLLSTVDRAGITQRTEHAILADDCFETYSYSASPKAGTKVEGWSVVQALPEMVALQFVPLVQDESAPMDAPRFVTPAPANITIALAAAPAPATVTTQPSAAAPPTSAASTPEFVPESTTAAVTTIKPAPKKATPAVGVPCTPPGDNYATADDGSTLKCTKAGGPSAKWVQSAPLLGTRTPGTPCEVGSGVATSPDGEEMFCLGQGPDSNVWTVLN
ncbi:hypothetical protein ACFWPK_33805 [Nocardia sp. NPDC058519]|uniref:hypothetical protein n=1 Tax=Nocardia sp. NPDC058519 TaxID=3346535 RepID=UPI00365B4BBC